MRIFFTVVLGLNCFLVISQIKGSIQDADTGELLPYVNVWVKNTARGGTTGLEGQFSIEDGQVGDTLLVSNLGYQDTIVLAQAENKIRLVPTEIALNEVVVIPMRMEQKGEIRSYDKFSKLKDFYYNGHYSLARYVPYSVQYDKTPFIHQITLVATSALKDVKFRVYLLWADDSGLPTSRALSDAYVLECGKGKSEVAVNFENEKIQFPKTGFFVVVDRLNLEENKYSNKLATDILQPAIGMENEPQPMNTWMTFGGRWLTPQELAEIPGWKNIAINVVLSN